MLYKRDKKAQTKSAVALIAPFAYASVLQSIVNSAKYLARQGYLVDVFIIQTDSFPLKSFEEENIEIYFLEILLVETVRKRLFQLPLVKVILDTILFFTPPHS